jgi:hypothetical protein
VFLRTSCLTRIAVRRDLPFADFDTDLTDAPKLMTGKSVAFAGTAASKVDTIVGVHQPLEMEPERILVEGVVGLEGGRHHTEHD